MTPSTAVQLPLEAHSAVYEVGERECRVCGCTEHDCQGCIERTGEPCHWVDVDLCSACEPPRKRPSDDFRKAELSNIDNSTIDTPPVVELPGGVKIYATRDGNHVTGRVDFPYEIGGRRSIPIDYRNLLPRPAGEGRGDGSIDNRQTTIDNTHDPKAHARLALVRQWLHLCESDKSVTRLCHARAVCEAAIGFKCSPRSLQLWARKLDTEGESGLSDRYEPAPRKILSLDAALAKDAITVCAWWCFRIGNEPVIDSKMVHSAAAIRPRAEYLRDILAAIDAYYAWPTDRHTMPFKPFARWAKYDFEKWLYRACDSVNASRPIDNRQSTIDNSPAVPLQTPLTVIPRDDSLPDSKTRKREANCFATRRAIAAMPGPEPEAPASLPRCLAASLPSSPVASLPRCLAASLPSSPVASLPRCLAAFPDHYRWLLIRAARGDADAVKQAVVTMPIWWDKLPEQLRNNIDARADAWKLDHRSATHYAVCARKLAMLGPSIRRPQKGPVTGCDLLELAV